MTQYLYVDLILSFLGFAFIF